METCIACGAIAPMVKMDGEQTVRLREWGTPQPDTRLSRPGHEEKALKERLGQGKPYHVLVSQFSTAVFADYIYGEL